MLLNIDNSSREIYLAENKEEEEIAQIKHCKE